MLSRLVVAVATQKFSNKWFSTKDLLDEVAWFDRKNAAPSTTAL